ncbi:MAG: tRNA (guanosine(37)-N1)-methyltransferase TrmD [Terriglobales bacterium]
MKFDILTIFPEFFRGPLEHGIVRRAHEAGLVEISIHDLREFTHDRHRSVDDRPFGGGEGMVLKPEPIFECLDALHVAPRARRIARRCAESVILTSAQGKLFSQPLAAELAKLERIVVICGRYEGVDERVLDCAADREISVGDYVLSGGELAAAVMVDAVTRLLPGALGNEASAWQESFSPAGKAPADDTVPDSTCASGGLLDYPHYTRPAVYRAMGVPEVLMGGNHEEIRRWRRRKALEKTLRNRPELLQRVRLSDEDRKLLEEIQQQATSS